MTENVQDKMARRDVEFDSGHVKLRGWLATPDTRGPHPVVILAHGLGGLKEWTIPAVARALVAAGIGALAFDYRNFGDSEGLPRDEVDHTGQIEDFRSAITFATTLPDVDAARIGIWGTSLGGRNVLAVAAVDRRIKCALAQVPLITTSPEHWAAFISDGDVDAYERALADDRRDRALGKEPRYIHFPEDPTTDYGSHFATFGDEERRNWNKRVTLRSFEPTPIDDIMPLMKQIAPTPLRMILTNPDADCSTDLQLAAYAAAGEPKSIMVLPGHHYILYTEWKDVAVAAARDWFVEHLTRE
ncbi:alpha/beta hydrolase [Amycolatopsis eburnea]|nr:alpha/beta fold hydrolase [Amycolatopsis eburnea]